ncbi:TIGR02922 family protein [Shewanella gaetbuli]|uniref:TIGR02922 family protein n=1 Tax=Shewanella gaetbuli TaxID=220752 RepID=A0A9X1ZLP3_9GAMM|nr:TIGR02922 family protein [Shewanella gaetbuli]MCL1141790.1 TIGR02922 family protein [Shewanella gaetbuli]
MAADKSQLATITVLYYEAPAGLEMHHAVLKDLPVSASGRVMIPDSFRQGKSIVSVLRGECDVLNSLGERTQSRDD